MSEGDFQLLETLGVEEGRPRHLPAHLDRMAASAAELGFPMDREALDAEAGRTASALVGTGRLRLLLWRDGAIEALALGFERPEGPLRVALARAPIDSGHPQLRHKTTSREHLTRLAVAGADDTLLVNERGELTEFTYGTVVLALGGRLLTPPLTCGLLPGVGRRLALESGRVSEAVLRPSDLDAAEHLWHLNSLRGWTPAVLGCDRDEPESGA